VDTELFPAPSGVDAHDPILALPKVSLHDHLDGALRPQTIIELAAAVDHELPTADAPALGQWFRKTADSGDLVKYLQTFEHTVAVMQTADALTRVAREYVIDAAADGCCYAEVRWAPEQHLRAGLDLDAAVAAVERGLDEGEAIVAEAGRVLNTVQVLTALRQNDNSLAIAELAVRHRDTGVAGFDIAGPEDGFPPADHRRAFDYLHSECMPVTIHAGEAAGLDSLHSAITACHAQRIGHGVRIVEDMDVVDGQGSLGRLAAWVLDQQIPLEVCPRSNVQTGAARSISSHPITGLKDLGYAVTINPDNRLMSATSVSREMRGLVDHAGWDLDDLEWATANALSAAFAPLDERERLLEDVVIPGFERVEL
jgi:adenosine deaminase